MNKRNRAATAAEGERPTANKSRTERRPITSFVPRRHYTEGQRRKTLMQNVLQDVELKGETVQTLPKKTGTTE